MNLRQGFSIFTLFMAILGLASVEAQAQSKKPLVRLNYSGSIYATTSVVGVEKGFFDQQGLIVNATPESSGQVALQALIGGSTDFAVGANVRPIQALARDLPIKVVALSSYGFAGYVLVPRKDSATKSLEELKGKTLAVQVGSGTHTVWLRYLRHKGISEKEFTIKNVETEQIPAAFEAGGIDGAIAWDPFATLIMEKGLGRAILGPKDMAEPLNVTYPFFVMTTEETIKRKPEVVQKFVNAWAKTLHYIHNNKAEVADLMQAFFAREGTKLQKETVKKLLDGTNYDRVRVSPADIDDTMESAKIQFEQKKLKKLPDLKQHVDNSFAEKAEKMVKAGAVKAVKKTK
ncbi:MAG: ABC transporter substrate-binding protein [Deltaproteobacteria bacterium]|nr:ABC transporter substrate-binding protein [Deltaproteobacteria bacterium]